MAHYQQNRFIDVVREEFPDFFQNKRVLEVGSWDVNGSVRHKFVNCEYIGVDISEGPGVNLVCEGQNLDFSTNHFDVVISCECFEHNRYWLGTFINMVRMLKPGGLCLFTCATIGRGEHGTKRRMKEHSLTAAVYPEDYYVNLDKNDFLKRIDLLNYFVEFKFFTNIYFKDLYFIGIKKGFSYSDDLRKIVLKVSKKVDGISTENGVTIKSMVSYRIEFYLYFILAKILGENNYHNLKHVIRTFFNKIRGKK